MKEVLRFGNLESFTGRILIEHGSDHCIIAGLSDRADRLEGLIYYVFETGSETMFASELQKHVSDQHIPLSVALASFPAILSPASLALNAKSVFQLTYESPVQLAFTDTIADLDLKINYTCSNSVFNTFKGFTQFHLQHYYTPWLKIYNGFSSPDQVEVSFTPKHFSVCVRGEGRILLVQSYRYQTPLDVTYYLLKIFGEFGLDQNECLVLISGLIEKDSELYRTLYDYFINIHFARAPLEFKNFTPYPDHYFSSIYNLAACAS